MKIDEDSHEEPFLPLSPLGWRVLSLPEWRKYFLFYKCAPGLVFSDEVATPQYNMAVLQDIVMGRHLEVMHEALQEAPGVKDGIALLKVWLHQRELDVVSCFMLAWDDGTNN